MQGLEGDAVLTKKFFVLLKTVQKLPLSESLAAWAWSTLAARDSCADAVRAWKCAATFDSALPAHGAREDSW